MKVIFSDHALFKISQRKLTKRDIVKTVTSPDFMKPSYHMREERYKNFGKNWLKAIVIKEGETITVVTAHWVAKFKKQ